MKSFRALTLGAVFSACICTAAAFAAPFARDQHSLVSDLYEVSIGRNGNASVELNTREQVFEGARPLVWIEGQGPKKNVEGPRLLELYGRDAHVMDFSDELGPGMGMLVQGPECNWLIRTYPGKTFIVVQASYHNSGEAAVKIKALLPWCVGEIHKGKVFVGENADAARILDGGRPPFYQPSVPGAHKDSCPASLWNVALMNPASGRGLVAGFITSARGLGQFTVERGEKPADNAFKRFLSQCIYDPPVEVKPGERLESELLFIDVAEMDVYKALERYGTAFAACNYGARDPKVKPDGMDPWQPVHASLVNERQIPVDTRVLAEKLKTDGWGSYTVGRGWETLEGSFAPDPARFPSGMQKAAADIRGRGLLAGLWTSPFLVKAGSPLMQQHPEWLAAPSADAKGLLADGDRILDVTAPGAMDFLKRTYERVAKEWGYDMVEVANANLLACAEKYTDPAVTRVQAVRMGMRAVREGVGTGTYITAEGPAQLCAPTSQSVRIAPLAGTAWENLSLDGKSADSKPWGAPEAIANAMRRAWMSPYMCFPDFGGAIFGGNQQNLTQDQRFAWITANAMSGGLVRWAGTSPAGLTEADMAILKRLLPAAKQAARPVDMLENNPPRIWTIPVTTPLGSWNVTAVFNWDASAPQAVTLDFAALGMVKGKPYTAFDFWQQR